MRHLRVTRAAAADLHYGESMQSLETDFEFERRFFVEELPTKLLEGTNPDLIVQTYFLADEGYALRVRLQATGLSVAVPEDIAGKEALERYMDSFDLCILAVKGPYVGGTRYEAERVLDIGVGTQMCLRGGDTLAKLRYGLWLGQDGWVIDRFLGPNRPLIIAECERTGPVTDLEIPSFCVEEVSGDVRFSNDELVGHPFSQWSTQYRRQLQMNPPRFDHSFGTNQPAPE